VRWRWNLGRALVVLRQRGGRRTPPPIQRMEADDLMAAVFPALAGCQENAGAGPIPIPDHPIVRQTMHHRLHEATDADGLVRLFRDFRSGAVEPVFRETTEPSPLAHEILNGRPYTYLDDAPLEERRTRAVALRRGLPESARDLGQLDPDAIARVRDEARPEPRDAEELHDMLLSLVVMRPADPWTAWFDELRARARGVRERGGGAALARHRAAALRGGPVPGRGHRAGRGGAGGAPRARRRRRGDRVGRRGARPSRHPRPDHRARAGRADRAARRGDARSARRPRARGVRAPRPLRSRPGRRRRRVLR